MKTQLVGKAKAAPRGGNNNHLSVKFIQDLLHTRCLSLGDSVVQQIIIHLESYHEQNTELQRQTVVTKYLSSLAMTTGYHFGTCTATALCLCKVEYEN